MTGQGPATREPALIARRFLLRRSVRDTVAVVVGLLLIAGVVRFGWPLAVAGAVVLLAGGYGLFVRRGAREVTTGPDRPMTAAKFAPHLIVLRDDDETVELRVRGQVRRLPADDDAAVRVFGRPGAPALLVVVYPATAAVVLGRVR